MKEDKFIPDLDMNVPVAYAAFEVVMDEDNQKAVDTIYVYVNKAYCEMVGRRKEELIGRSFRSVYDNADERWFDYCYEAAKGRQVRSRMYSREVGHWLEFEVEPAGEGRAAFIFMNVDMDHVEKMKLRQSSNTDDIIIRLAKIMNGGESYEKAVNHMLAELGTIIHADRLYILETDGIKVSNTFEWCREGVTPEIQTLQDLDYDDYIGGWEKFLVDNSSLVLEDIEVLREDDPVDYENLKRQGIKSIMDSPIYDGGSLIGYIGADNYEISDAVNTQKILETISYFLGARMVNQKLLSRLDYLSHRDMLTGARNRNSFMEKLEELEGLAHPAGIVFGDVNGLKRANDEEGHVAGDKLLRRAAKAMQQFWGDEFVYRAGGDEFVVLLPDISECAFYRKFEEFYDAMKAKENVSIAFGAQWAESGSHLNAAFNRADRKMYQDKKKHYHLCLTEMDPEKVK
ncbi:sensor domain-containing diguanylate cyclase [uncultured Dialister sp.]|uniref:sensor domain-containing diguanylate cyclase n=1 Tax=uncultured Dialister sp. TaxID=278064 RepID=UPI0025979F93|nr:sensor domain-containing diguanylate cyclase [uncultured Dialister sp.]